jgi:hypothetical protein
VDDLLPPETRFGTYAFGLRTPIMSQSILIHSMDGIIVLDWRGLRYDKKSKAVLAAHNVSMRKEVIGKRITFELQGSFEFSTCPCVG